MKEQNKVREELKEQFPEIDWPEVRMEVPAGYWEEARREAFAKLGNPDGHGTARALWISMISLAAAILFLIMIWNPFTPTVKDPLADINEGELEQFLELASADLQEADWAYLFASKETFDMEAVEIELTEEDWNKIIEEWPYELNEQTIYELQNQKQ